MKKDDIIEVNRPWGSFRRYVVNESVTVKTIIVKKGETLSLQEHEKRGEFWRILSGNPEVTIGQEGISAKPGDEFFVPQNMQHRVSAPVDDVEFLEIDSGEFREDDIIRINDKYGRA